MDAVVTRVESGAAAGELSRRGVLAYRLLWSMLLLVAVFANLAAPYFNQQMRKMEFEPFAELGLRQSQGRYVQVPHRPSLERAGIVAGSEIVAVQGQPVAEDIPLRDLARRLAAAPSPAQVTIKAPQGTVRTYSLPRSDRWIDLSYVGTGLTPTSRVVIDLVFAGLANLGLMAASVLLFWRRPRDRLAALLAVSMMGFAAFENLTWYTWHQLDLGDPASILFGAAAAGLFVGLLLCPDGRFTPLWSRWVAAALVIGTAAGIGASYMGAPQMIVAACQVFPILAVLPALRSRFRQTPIGSESWQQQRWIVLGMSLAAAALLTTFVLSSLVTGVALTRQQLVWGYIGAGIALSLMPLFLSLGMLVALLRYRLYDSDAALSRSAGFALVGLSFAALFAGFAKAIEIGVEQVSGGSAGAIPSVAAAALAAVVVTPAQSRIQSWTDNRFRKALAHLRRDLPACVEDLRETASLPELADEVLKRVTAGVQATGAALEIEGEVVAVHGIKPAGGEWPLALPLRVEHAGDLQLGALLIGPRPDGSLPRDDQLEALREVADPVGRAIRVVRAREGRERQQQRFWDEVQGRLQALEERLTRSVPSI